MNNNLKESSQPTKAFYLMRT